MSVEKRVAIFVDSRKESGGEYQHLLYTIENIKKNNNNKIKFLIVCLSKKLNLNLESGDVEIKYFSLNIFQRYICYLRNYNSLISRLKKYFFLRNKFEEFLKENNVDLVYFLSPSQYSLYLENIKFLITIPDLDHREHLEFPEVVDNNDTSKLPKGTAEESYNYALDLSRQLDFENAEKAFKEFLIRHKNNKLQADAQYWLGRVYFAQKKYEEAAIAMAEFNSIFPNDPRFQETTLLIAEAAVNFAPKNQLCDILNQSLEFMVNPSEKFVKRINSLKNEKKCSAE